MKYKKMIKFNTRSKVITNPFLQSKEHTCNVSKTFI